jgi:Ca2+-binding RTX toxin-like protein
MPASTAAGVWTVSSTITVNTIGPSFNLALASAPSGLVQYTSDGASGTDIFLRTVDPGPSVKDTTTPNEKVAHGTMVAVGTVTPGLTGDALTLTEISGPIGAVTLSGDTVYFAAPATASGPVTFSYEISDQLGDLSAVVSDTLAVDPGPTAGTAHVYISAGQNVDLTSLLLSLDTPGLPGDTLRLSGVASISGIGGTLRLINGDLSYTAPASGGSGTLTYTVSDQLRETATGSVGVTLLSSTGGTITLAGSGNFVLAGNGNYLITGGTGGNSISLGNGHDIVSLSGNNNTVVLGDVNDNVSLSGNNNTATLGNGNDIVTAGANSAFTLGNGNDTIYAGPGDTITLACACSFVPPHAAMARSLLRWPPYAYRADIVCGSARAYQRPPNAQNWRITSSRLSPLLAMVWSIKSSSSAESILWMRET